MNAPKIIVALDFPEAVPALALADRLQPSLCRLKVGKELFTAAGPQLVEQLQKRGLGLDVLAAAVDGKRIACREV